MMMMTRCGKEKKRVEEGEEVVRSSKKEEQEVERNSEKGRA